MASNIIFIAIVALCVSQIAARPDGDAAAHDHLHTMFEKTELSFDAMREGLAKFFNYEENKEAKEFLDSVKSNSKVFGDKLIELTKEGEEKMKEHSTEAEKAVHSLQEFMATSAKKIEELAPEAAGKAKEYNAHLETVYKEVMEKAQSAFKVVDKDTSAFREQGKKYIEEVMTVVKSNIEKMNHDVQKAISEHTKKP